MTAIKDELKKKVNEPGASATLPDPGTFRVWRLSLGLTPNDVSEVTSISPGTVISFEDGRQDVLGVLSSHQRFRRTCAVLEEMWREQNPQRHRWVTKAAFVNWTKNYDGPKPAEPGERPEKAPQPPFHIVELTGDERRELRAFFGWTPKALGKRLGLNPPHLAELLETSDKMKGEQMGVSTWGLVVAFSAMHSARGEIEGNRQNVPETDDVVSEEGAS